MAKVALAFTALCLSAVICRASPVDPVTSQDVEDLTSTLPSTTEKETSETSPVPTASEQSSHVTPTEPAVAKQSPEETQSKVETTTADHQPLPADKQPDVQTTPDGQRGEELPVPEPLIQYKADSGGYRNNSVPQPTIFVTLPPTETSSEDETVNDVETDWRPNERLNEAAPISQGEEEEKPSIGVQENEESAVENQPAALQPELGILEQLNQAFQIQEDLNTEIINPVKESEDKEREEGHASEQQNVEIPAAQWMQPDYEDNQPTEAVDTDENKPTDSPTESSQESEVSDDEEYSEDDKDIGAQESQHNGYNEEAALYFESKRYKSNKKKKTSIKEAPINDRIRGNIKITSYIADIAEMESSVKTSTSQPAVITTPKRGDADMISTFFVAAHDSLDPPVTSGRIRKKIIKPIRIRGKPQRGAQRGHYRGQVTYRRRVVSTTTTTPLPTTTRDFNEATTQDFPGYLPVEQITPPPHYVPINQQAFAVEINHNMPQRTTTQQTGTSDEELTENYPKNFPKFPKRHPPQYTPTEVLNINNQYETTVPDVSYPIFEKGNEKDILKVPKDEQIHLKPELSEDSKERTEVKENFEETNQADTDGLTSSDTILAPIQAAVSLSNHVQQSERAVQPTIEKQEIREEPVYKTTIEIQKSIPFEIKEDKLNPSTPAYPHHIIEQDPNLENNEFLQQVALAYHRLSNQGGVIHPEEGTKIELPQGLGSHSALDQEHLLQQEHASEHEHASELDHGTIGHDQQLELQHDQQLNVPPTHLVTPPEQNPQQMYYVYRTRAPQTSTNVYFVPFYKTPDYRGSKGHVGQYIMQQSYKNIERPKYQSLYRPYYYNNFFDLNLYPYQQQYTTVVSPQVKDIEHTTPAYVAESSEDHKSEIHQQVISQHSHAPLQVSSHVPDPPVNTQPYPYGYGLPYYTFVYQPSTYTSQQQQQRHPYRYETINYLPRTGRAPFRPSQPMYTSQYPPQTYVVAVSARDARSLKQLCVEYGGFKPPLIPSVQIDEELPLEKSDN